MVKIAKVRRGLSVLQKLVKDRTAYKLSVLEQMDGKFTKTCPICGYQGLFKAIGNPPRFNAMCRRCGSLERHRLLILADQERNFISSDKKVLHFAPEKIIREYVRKRTSRYLSADISGRDVDKQENIENLSFGDHEFDLIICIHVLEHVDDRQALQELYRVLRNGGLLILMIPIVEGWDRTYENPEIIDPHERMLHFGTTEHVRYYGKDFRDRVTAAGFTLDEYTAEGDTAVAYALRRGEKVFFAHKPA